VVTTETPRRQQIEDAASELFRERGYAATSVRDIAQALNLQGGSLYAHVASKEDVLWAIVRRAADRFDAEVRPIAAEAARGPAERLRAMIGAHVGVVTGIQKDAAVFLHEWRFLSGPRRDEVAALRDSYEHLYRDLIAEGIAAGEFRPVDPVLTTMAMLSALNGIPSWYASSGELSATQIADQHADLFMSSLACTADQPEVSR
jgi:TetR/AcrR family transcriptional regulator, cholesterol catabolism regulator